MQVRLFLSRSQGLLWNENISNGLLEELQITSARNHGDQLVHLGSEQQDRSSRLLSQREINVP